MRKSKRKAQPMETLIYLLCFFAVMILNWLLPFRVYLWVCLFGMTLFPWKSLNKEKREKRDSRDMLMLVRITVATVCFLALLITGIRYSYGDGSLFPYWEVLLILGGLISVYVGAKWLWRTTRWYGAIGYFVLATFVAFLILGVVTAHLNCLLDFSRPVECEAVIEDKEHHRRRKGADDYEFVVTVDGETFDLGVSSEEYRRHEIGDRYTFKKYNGAFGKAFYLPE